MSSKLSRYNKTLEIAEKKILRGTTTRVDLKISESFTGEEIFIPLQVRAAAEPGPCIFISGAIHGDELNGPGIIHEIILDTELELKSGTLILAPVINLLGLERNSRYLPDRRDLNRCFPGSPTGSLASRIAAIVFNEIVLKCDFGIDIHAAAAERTNYPNVRADLRDPLVRKLAKAFGTELIVNGVGPMGSLRSEACKVGCATICFEAGEILQVKKNVLHSGLIGVRNVLIEFGMLNGNAITPSYQTRVNRSFWIRADEGGFIQFSAELGQPLEAGEEIGRICDLMGKECRKLVAPKDGVVMGMTTMPIVKPGYPVCHLAITKKKISAIKKLTLNKTSENC